MKRVMKSKKHALFPIISHGIVHIHDNKYLMICRRKTLGYIDFIRGKYLMHATFHISNLIDEMSITEKEDVLKNNFHDLWIDLWGVESNDSIDEFIANTKFKEIKQGYEVNGERICLDTLIAKSKTNWVDPEWGFPKGRQNTYESELACALREYEEETGLDKHKLSVFKNILPFEEIFMGSNYKSYTHKYYIATSSSIVKKNEFQPSEVSNMKWFTYEEAIQIIRPYNVERIQLLSFIHKCFERYVISTKN
jgi:ADP-ribose pyrophosphatase YjhB (NUDIX family)